jgi:hypothetical protein
MTPKQKKIAAKAEPRNKIDAKDFAVLRAEKAKGRGMGLQDEKMKPGKVMKALGGRMASMSRFKSPSSPEATAKKSSAGMGSAMAVNEIKSKKIKEITGIKKGKIIKARAGKMLRPDPTKPISSVPPSVKKTRKKFKTLEEMRKAKGFKPGETAEQFNKRQQLAKRAVEAAKATRIGKIVLPIALAGVGAVQYLKSKMKEKKEKKMGGGMMMRRPMMASKGRLAALAKKKGLPIPLMKNPKFKFKNMGIFPYVKLKKKMSGGLSEATQKLKAQGKMGGGMMQRPMMAMGGGMMPGYKKGKSVMAKGCKLGRKKPTKMYT